MKFVILFLVCITENNLRILYRLKSSASSPRGFKQMTGMIIYFLRQRRKKLDHTNYHSPEKSRDWKPMSQHTSMFPICDDWLPSSHNGSTLFSYLIYLTLLDCSLTCNVVLKGPIFVSGNT